MNKFEFQRRLGEGEDLLAEGRYEEAVEVFDGLDLSLIDQPRRLQNIAKAYERCKRYEDAEDLLLDAREIAPKSRATTFHLCTVALKAGEMKEAKEYYQDFLKIGARDPQRFVLQYRIAEAEKQPEEELIRILETYRKEEPDDRWMFQLASIYAQRGENEKAIEVCNDIDLWFFNGKFVKMARELREHLGSEAPDYTAELEEIRREEAEAAKEPEAQIPAFVQAQPEEKKAVQSPYAAESEEEVRELYPQEIAEQAAAELAETLEDAKDTVAETVEKAAEAVPAKEEVLQAAAEEKKAEAPAVKPAPVIHAKPAVIEEEDMMFSLDYSSSEAETVKDFFEGFGEEEKYTVRIDLPKQPEPEKGEVVQEEAEEKAPEQDETPEDQHIVFKVTNSAVAVPQEEEEEDILQIHDSVIESDKDIFHFDFDFDDDEDEEEEEEDVVLEEVPEEKQEKARTDNVIEESEVIDEKDDRDENDDDEDDDEFSEDDEPAKRPKLFGFLKKGGKKAPKHRGEDEFEDDFDEDDENEDEKEEKVEKKAVLKDEEDEEEEKEPDLETLALQAAIRRREEDSKLFGDLPVDPDVDKDVWHFMVHAKTPELSLECAREKLRELMDVNPNCPSKMLKISAEKIGSANIINSLDRFLNNMVIVEGASKLTDQQISDFAKVLNKDDRALLIVFTDTKEELVRLFEREPALKESFTAVFEGKRFTATDLMQVAKTYLYQEDAKLTPDAEEYLSDYITRQLAEGKGFYRTNVKSLVEDALDLSENGGFLGLFMGKVDKYGYLSISARHLKKAEAMEE